MPEQRLVMANVVGTEVTAAQLRVLTRAALGLSAGAFSLEKIVARGGRVDAKQVLGAPLRECYTWVHRVLVAFSVDVAAYAKPERYHRALTSRPMQLFQLREAVADLSRLAAALAYGDNLAEANSSKNHATWNLEVAYVALGIWGHLRCIAVRHRLDPEAFEPVEVSCA